MPVMSRLAVLSGLLLLPTGVIAQTTPVPVAAQPSGFSHAGVARDAIRYEAWLKANIKPSALKAREIKIAAEKILAAGADPRAASRSFSEIIVADATDASAWLGLARSLLAIQPDANTGSERYELPVNG